MSITKIVLSGGPCAGKTTALGIVKKEFEKLGYTVLTVPETATELMRGGVSPWSCGAKEDFQRLRLELQLEKESVFRRAAATMAGDVLIVCDRAALDGKIYMTDEVWRGALSSLGKSEASLRDSYDAVFHLETSAKGALSHYMTGAGTGRGETPEVSAKMDDRLISAWCGNPHLRIIPACDDFDEKMKRLIKEISSFLGVPVPMETERKFLIEYPDLAALGADPFCEKVEIEQVYLVSDASCERVRRRGCDGDSVFFHTEKRSVDAVRRIEIEERITEDEYKALLRRADPSRGIIRKDRYCLVFGKKYFEIDVYPFWNDRAVMEIELTDPDEEFEIPDRIKVIKEVTGDESYSNASLAKMIK